MTKGTRTARRACAGATAALLIAFAPAAAWAGHGHGRGVWGPRHDAHAPRHHALRGHHAHGPGCEGRLARVHHAYGCRPCGRHFASLRRLRTHVHHHHHVPAWKLPFVLVASTAGLLFPG